MADQVYTTDRRGRGASAVAWIALVVAILALILGWIAYNRTGEDLENQIQTQVQEGINAADDAAQSTEEAVDAGPDGVDEDDTDVQTTTP